MALLGTTPAAHAQTCTTNPTNGGILQSGGTCVNDTNVSTGFGTAVDASNAANVTQNGTVTANGGGTGISATTGAIVTANGNVTAAGIGLSSASGGTIIANAITLGNTGGGAQAMLANGGTIIANGVTINWPNGFGTALVDATNGGVIQFTAGSSVTVPSGGFGIAVFLSDGAPSAITADGLTVNITSGSGGENAFKAQGGASISLTNSTVNNSVASSGGGDTGLWATGAGSTITATNTTVSVGGSGGDFGVRADTGGSVVMNGGSVTVINGAGGLLQNGGTVTMAGTNVTASGSGGIGFLFNNGGAASTLNYSDGTITASNASFSVQGATANINLANATAVANNNTLLATNSTGSTTFNAQTSVLQGVITTDAGSTSNVNLTQRTIWTMTGNSNATNVINDASTINYTAPSGDPTQLSSYKTLTVNNYTGIGGTIVLNTFLGNDSSPSDRLVINGGTGTGSTGLRILNTAGPGDQTVANGILVVQTLNGATTTPGAFSLLGAVRAGAYNYFLFRGGVNGDAPQDWFLRSTFIVPPVVVPPSTQPISPFVPPSTQPITVPPVTVPPSTQPITVPPTTVTPTPSPTPSPPQLAVPGPVIPADPPPATLPPGLWPIIGPELATYGTVQPIARQVGLATLGTLNQRIGDTMTLANAGCDTKGWGRSDWGRFYGQEVNGHYQAFADPRTDGWLAGFQGGIDLWRNCTTSGDRDSAGLYLAYTQASADVTGLVTNPAATGYMLTHTGSNNMQAYSVGGYWTHYGPTGWYVDAILQGTFYNANAASQFAQLSVKGTGFAASLETGYPIPLPLGPGFALEPQAQIIWQQVAFDDASDIFGPVGLGTTSGPIGRVGLRGQWNITDAQGMLWQPYVGANYWRGWGAEASTTFGINQVKLLENMQTVEAIVGVTGRLNKSFSVFAQAGYQFDVSGSDNAGAKGARGTAGIRYSW